MIARRLASLVHFLVTRAFRATREWWIRAVRESWNSDAAHKYLIEPSLPESRSGGTAKGLAITGHDWPVSGQDRCAVSAARIG
jgi:hypothetical protein